MGLPYQAPSGGYEDDSTAPDADPFAEDGTSSGYDRYSEDTASAGGYQDADDEDDDEDDDLEGYDDDESGFGSQAGWDPGRAGGSGRM